MPKCREFRRVLFRSGSSNGLPEWLHARAARRWRGHNRVSSAWSLRSRRGRSTSPAGWSGGAGGTLPAACGSLRGRVRWRGATFFQPQTHLPQTHLNFSTSHSRSGSSRVDSLPTTALRNGDFSGVTLQGQPVTIYDPLSGSPFPGNMIPKWRFNPVSVALLQYYPQPTFGGLVQNYAIDPSNPSNRNSFAVRLSGAINNKDRLNINQQFSFNSSNSEQLLGFKDTSSGYGMSSTVGWTHSFKPRFNNSANLAFSRNISKGTPYFAYTTNVAGQMGVGGKPPTPPA